MPMADKFHHEAIYRGADQLAKLASQHLTICGAGALGSHLADNLARQGFRHLRVIDRDRVEEHNVSTQLYGESDVGAWKVEVLRQRLFRATGIEIEAHRKELIDRTARTLLQDGGLVIDAFDNSASRRLVQEHCRALNLPCLHVGLYADYSEVIWDERYRVPQDVGGDVATTHWPAT
jgi:molybdopterin/thiamine biosynthesis adenylyltransferase